MEACASYTRGRAGCQKSGKATFLRGLRPVSLHSLTGRLQSKLPVVRSCKEAIPNGITRKSPHMSPIFDQESEGLRALRHLPGLFDRLCVPIPRDALFYVAKVSVFCADAIGGLRTGRSRADARRLGGLWPPTSCAGYRPDIVCPYHQPVKWSLCIGHARVILMAIRKRKIGRLGG